jgi:hypothetical protein
MPRQGSACCGTAQGTHEADAERVPARFRLLPVAVAGHPARAGARVREGCKLVPSDEAYRYRSESEEPTQGGAEGAKRGAQQLSQMRLARALDASLCTSDPVCGL